MPQANPLQSTTSLTARKLFLMSNLHVFCCHLSHPGHDKHYFLSLSNSLYAIDGSYALSIIFLFVWTTSSLIAPLWLMSFDLWHFTYCDFDISAIVPVLFFEVQCPKLDKTKVFLVQAEGEKSVNLQLQLIFPSSPYTCTKMILTEKWMESYFLLVAI